MQSQIPVDEKEVLFFLYSLKKGEADNERYRKMLINIFLVAAYLYDDKLTYILSAGDKNITITDNLLDEIEENNASCEGSFLGTTAPPNKR